MELIKEKQSQEKIALWVDNFLRGEGKNIPLADILKEQKRHWIKVTNFPLNKLVRCCGPEDNMEYKESIDEWNKRVDSLVNYIKAGGKFDPFITYFGAHYDNKEFSVRDGNHRLGACEKLGIQTHDTFIWCDTENDLEKVKQLIHL